MSQPGVDRVDDQLAEVRQLASEFVGLQPPTPDLSPKQIVDIQIAAMADSDKKRGALQCASFASPENFAVTGPLEKFARMLDGPKFLVLSSPDLVVVGDAIFRDDKARVLVTVLEGEVTRAFVWVLAKQGKAGLLHDCWLTEGVFPLRANDRLNANEI